MHAVLCDIPSKNGASHMNARATISNGRMVKENGGGTVCMHTFAPLYVNILKTELILGVELWIVVFLEFIHRLVLEAEQNASVMEVNSFQQI
jgi:hypothetical protein